MIVTRLAPCKVNLTLDVFAPRPDGFHELDSVVALFTPADVVTVQCVPSTSGQHEISLTCNDASLPTDSRNLAYRAAEAYLRHVSEDVAISVTIRLEKHLPHQAGLGGGSSDAAAVLMALAHNLSLTPLPPLSQAKEGESETPTLVSIPTRTKLRQTPILALPDSPLSLAREGLGVSDDLSDIAAEIGSDVPLFLADDPVRMRGRGEHIDLLLHPPRNLHGVIIKPDCGIPTAAAYALLDALPARPVSDATSHLLELLAEDASIEAIGAALHNDFEAAILPAFPAVGEVHRALTEAGAIRALLCGSGAAVFGLARDAEHAAQIANTLTGRFPYVAVAQQIESRHADGVW